MAPGKALLVPRDLTERAADMYQGVGLRGTGGKVSQVWKGWEGLQENTAGMTISSTARLVYLY